MSVYNLTFINVNKKKILTDTFTYTVTHKGHQYINNLTHFFLTFEQSAGFMTRVTDSQTMLGLSKT